MGLDMYLIKKTCVRKWDYIPDEKQWNIVITRGGKPYTSIKPEKIQYIEEEIMYWRKADHIHSWFVKNIQDGEDNCREYHVTKEDLKILLEDCYAVYNDPSDASLILPVYWQYDQYDQYYFDQIKITIKTIETILEEWNEEADIYYRSSW